MRVIVCLIALVAVAVSLGFAARGATAKTGSQCKKIGNIKQAAKSGEMPAIVSSLHGGAPIPNALLSCSG